MEAPQMNGDSLAPQMPRVIFISRGQQLQTRALTLPLLAAINLPMEVELMMLF
jgi:hypothetical protein